MCLTTGGSLKERLENEYVACMPQDMVDTKERVERLVEIIEGKLELVQHAWFNVKKNIVDAKVSLSTVLHCRQLFHSCIRVHTKFLTSSYII